MLLIQKDMKIPFYAALQFIEFCFIFATVANYNYTYNFSRKSVAFFDAVPSLILIPGIVGT